VSGAEYGEIARRRSAHFKLATVSCAMHADLGLRENDLLGAPKGHVPS
jgi:hypothetical protein